MHVCSKNNRKLIIVLRFVVSTCLSAQSVVADALVAVRDIKKWQIKYYSSAPLTRTVASELFLDME